MARIVVLALALVAGCNSDLTHVAGRVQLDADVDAHAFTHLQLRAFARSGPFHPDEPPLDEPAFTGVSALADIEFPYEYRMVGVEDETGRWRTIAWLTNDADAEWLAEAEPFGATEFRWCECATHSPAEADDVDVVIEPPAD